MSDYNDIIHLPHHKSKRHTPMSRENRAAQFAPFAALSGYGESVTEAARLTDKRAELNDEQIELLNSKLNFLFERLDEEPIVAITHFVPDQRKSGGAYQITTGKIKRIDELDGIVEMKDKRRIKMENILDIEGEIFF